jgi:hypothetical protein
LLQLLPVALFGAGFYAQGHPVIAVERKGLGIGLSGQACQGEEAPHAYSFRDPGGSVLATEKGIFRVVNAARMADLKSFLASSEFAFIGRYPLYLFWLGKWLPGRSPRRRDPCTGGAMFRRLVRGREWLYRAFNAAVFEDAVRQQFAIVRWQAVGGMERRLYLMRKN